MRATMSQSQFLKMSAVGSSSHSFASVTLRDLFTFFLTIVFAMNPRD